MTIKIDPEDAKRAIVKGIKTLSREHARAGRSLKGQVIESKKGGEDGARKYPKHIREQDLTDEEWGEIQEKLREKDEA